MLAVPPSVPTGRVSFGPERENADEPTAPREPKVRMARAIAVTSGKGGVGKSNVAVNLSAALAAAGRRVCLIDADLGLANADVLCGVSPHRTLDDVVRGRCKLGQALLAAPGNFHLLPGASGVARMADLPEAEQAQLLRRLSILERIADTIVIDTGAGISRNVLAFAAAAHTAVVVVTPEPTSITDGYGLIKSLVQRAHEPRIEVVVNMARGEAEGRSVFRRIDRVSRTFLQHPLRYAGTIPEDRTVRDAVHRRTPLVVMAPGSPAARGIAKIGRKLMDAAVDANASDGSGEQRGFFSRLKRWIASG